MSFDRHPKLMLVVATVCVIIAWFGAMRLLAFMGVSQNLIIIIAPISSVVVAMVFLYLGRKRLRGPKETDISSMLDLESPMLVTGEQAPGPKLAAEVSAEPEAQSTIVATELPAVQEIKSPTVAAEILAEPEAETPTVATELPAEPEAPGPSVSPELPTEPETENPMVAAEMPPSVQRVMNEIEKRVEIRCLVITAPSHGVLQDRLNNWLSGNYGRVVSTSMAMNEKGFFLTVFYEPSPIQ